MKVEINFKDETQPYGDPKYGSNSVKTAKYTRLNFIPKNFYYQFSKVANIYFAFLTTLQFIKQISITNGTPTILPTLLIVIGISMFKDYLEDKKRWKQDDQENNSFTQKYSRGAFARVQFKDLHIGDVVRVENNQRIPADLLLIDSSDRLKFEAFVETKNLDGETNLNKKQVPQALIEDMKASPGEKPCADGFQHLKKHKASLTYEPANPFLYSFKGSLSLGGKCVPLSNSNVLLRGMVLKNTDSVTGVVLYNGHCTKLMKNNVKSKEKKSQLEVKMNNYILLIFAIQLFFCLTGSGIYVYWVTKKGGQHGYLSLDDGSLFLRILIRFLNWVLIFGNFVPISLLVTVETVKYFQAKQLNVSRFLVGRDGARGQVNSSNLNEELGQIKYVFSDKTGTLTQNRMVFKKVCVRNRFFPASEDYDRSILDQVNEFVNEEVTNVEFEDLEFFRLSQTDHEVQALLRFLALCHSVNIYKGQYGASSPDELALVNFAKKCGFQFMEIDGEFNMVLREQGELQRYRLLKTFPFSSKRKRMSLIVEDL